MKNAVNIEWNKLWFSYIKTDYRYISYWKEGSWDNGKLTSDNTLTISEGSPCLHYGQQCFEGLKAYTTKEGKIQLFRPDQNAKRMIKSCKRLFMPEVPEEKFIDACIQVVKANEAWVPPYGTVFPLEHGPLVMGIGDNIGVRPATEYIFTVFCMPVGPYFKGGLTPLDFSV